MAQTRSSTRTTGKSGSSRSGSSRSSRAKTTGRSNGFVRMHYDLAAESALAWQSFDYFITWHERVGSGDCGFVETGRHVRRTAGADWEFVDMELRS